ncbi:MAG: PEP-CTERM sorting domain-containing protein [Gemmatimonas sp.]
MQNVLQKFRVGRTQFSRYLAIVSIAAACSAIAAVNVGAQTFNTTFGAPVFTCLNIADPSFCVSTSNNRPTATIRSTGDFWNQSIAGSGIGTVSSLSFVLTMAGNLTGANAMQFEFLLNGTHIGSSPTYSQTGQFDIVSPFNFSFAGISAASYDVKVRVSASSVATNTQGLSLLLDGSSTIAISGAQTTVTPEPGTSALMLAGLAGVGVIARRRRSRT